jgi:hypothetical protein
MKIHQLSVAEALASLGTGPDGLSQAEALRRLRRSGPNRIGRLVRQPALLRLLKEFVQFFSLILWVAASSLRLPEPIAQRAGKDFDDRGRRLGDAFDHADRQGRCAEHGDQAQRQQGVDHLRGDVHQQRHETERPYARGNFPPAQERAAAVATSYDQIGRRCGSPRPFEAKCPGIIRSALARDEWTECLSCGATGRAEEGACRHCNGAGWTYVRR